MNDKNSKNTNSKHLKPTKHTCLQTNTQTHTNTPHIHKHKDRVYVPVVIVNVNLRQVTNDPTSQLVCRGHQALFYVMAFQVDHFKQDYVVQGKDFPCDGRESLNLLQQGLSKSL